MNTSMRHRLPGQRRARDQDIPQPLQKFNLIARNYLFIKSTEHLFSMLLILKISNQLLIPFGIKIFVRKRHSSNRPDCPGCLRHEVDNVRIDRLADFSPIARTTRPISIKNNNNNKKRKQSLMRKNTSLTYKRLRLVLTKPVALVAPRSRYIYVIAPIGAATINRDRLSLRRDGASPSHTHTHSHARVYKSIKCIERRVESSTDRRSRTASCASLTREILRSTCPHS